MLNYAYKESDIQCPPEGSPKSKIALVGMAPSFEEVKEKRPFVGPSGRKLNELLYDAGLHRSDFYITNVLKHQPARNNLSEYWDEKKCILHAAARPHIGALIEELNATDVNIVMPLGNMPLAALCPDRIRRARITKWRGSILESPYLPNKQILPTVHPASIIYGDALIGWAISRDFKIAKAKQYSNIVQYRKRNLLIRPNFDEAKIYLESLVSCKRIAFDIEVVGGIVNCIAFAKSPDDGACIPINHYMQQQEAALWRIIAKILGNPNTEKVAQNAIFDTAFLLQHYKIITRGLILDTMIAHKRLYPDLNKGLDFLVSMHCDGEPYYKDEGKIWKQKDVKDWTQFFRYNVMDAVTTFEVWEGIEEDIKHPDYWPSYMRDISKIDPLNFATMRGIAANEEFQNRAKQEVTEHIKATQNELNTIVGRVLNVKSKDQCAAYFYDELGVKPYTIYDPKTNKSRITTNAKAIQKLAIGTENRAGIRAAELVLRVRSDRDLLSKNLNVALDKDDRFRCSYDITGTVTGRLSSSKTIDGTGTNHQNLPRIFRSFLLADPGHIFVAWDKRQAEWVVVAYQSGDENMIRVIESGDDAHIVSAIAITKLPREYLVLEADDKYAGKARDSDQVETGRKRLEIDYPEFSRDKLKRLIPDAFFPVRYSGRQLGKHSNHGWNYDMSAGRFAEEYETTLKEASMIHSRYHALYPGIKRLHKRIQDKLIKDRHLTSPYPYNRVRFFMGEVTSVMLRSGYDFVPQSAVGENTNEGMERLYRCTDPVAKPFQFLINCHDEVLGQYPVADLSALGQLVQLGIEKMHEDFEVDCLDGNFLKFSIATDAAIGFDWRNMVKLKDSKDAAGFTAQLPNALEKAQAAHTVGRRASILG